MFGIVGTHFGLGQNRFNAHAKNETLSTQGITESETKKVCGNEQFTVRIRI
jgi:hypothetical protein